MPVTLKDIIMYGSSNMPEADGVTVGGAVDFTKRVSFADLPTTAGLDVVSSSASDTATKLQLMGRDASGTIQTPAAITLTGTTLIANAFAAQQFERILAGVITGGSIAGLANPGGTAAVGDVAVLDHTRTVAGHTAQVGSANTNASTPPVMKLASGDGATIGALTYGGLGAVIRITGGTGTGQLRSIIAQYSSAGAYGGANLGADFVAINRDWGTIPDATSTYDIAPGMLFEILPNPVTAITRLFATAAADVPGGASRTYYDKIFAVNTNTVTALQTAALEVMSETPGLPSGTLLDMALTKVLNDTATAANRQTLPVNGDTTALTFVTQPSPVSVIASPGTLPNSAGAGNASNAQGIWLRLTLPAGAASNKSTTDLRTIGTST